VVLTDTESSPFSSPSVIIFEESHHLFEPGVKVNCFAFFTMVLSIFTIFTGFFNGPVLDFPFLISHKFRNENIGLKADTG
jgi:hypothetical protein